MSEHYSLGVDGYRPNAGAVCGWKFGYQDCSNEGCRFPASRCVLVDAERSEVLAGDDGMDDIEVGPLTYDRLRCIAERLNCTVSAALEEVLREFKA